MIENKFFKTSIGIVCAFGGTLCIVILLSSILRGDKIDLDKGGPPNNFWVPTKEDIQYQDSLWNIINKTKSEVDTIKKSMEHIMYKLDRLSYPDGSWDSVRIPVNEDNYDMDCGDTIKVRATMYHPVEAQCDSDPLITADGSKIDPYNVSDWNWIAVSRDLLVSGGGCLNYGDSVYVVAGHKTGWYHIHDTMHKRKKKQIDFLESIGTSVYRYTEAELIVNV